MNPKSSAMLLASVAIADTFSSSASVMKTILLYPVLPSVGLAVSLLGLWGFRWALREEVVHSSRILLRLCGACTALSSVLGFGLGLAILALSLAGVIYLPV